ncbi:receptor-type protein kinase, putative [Bodo saltans]|uniref:Receptor-type protein kinase, putative n=1 Tax=Bodo saltans TaxID=75058 RepID=A0A0S4KLE0_BODSA|nr:receptor-type protein kinase, putative [Bodo saltans]|eukprot:CUI15219.1 receptor-type protein kinase, putative [Bodo saltans]
MSSFDSEKRQRREVTPRQHDLSLNTLVGTATAAASLANNSNASMLRDASLIDHPPATVFDRLQQPTRRRVPQTFISSVLSYVTSNSHQEVRLPLSARRVPTSTKVIRAGAQTMALSAQQGRGNSATLPAPSTCKVLARARQVAAATATVGTSFKSANAAVALRLRFQTRICSRHSTVQRLLHLDFSVNSKAITDNGIACICSSMRRLRSIALSECDGVTDVSLKHIGELLHSLRSLNLHECRNVTNIGLDSIRGLLDLERLHFTTFSYSYTVVDDDGLRLMEGMFPQAETTRHLDAQ